MIHSPIADIVRTKRLVLRRMTMDDAAVLHEIFRDPKAMEFWSTAPHENIERTRAFMAETIAKVAAGESDDFVVTLDGKVIGKAGIWSASELGFIFSPQVWGTGIAREAVNGVLTRAFAHGVTRVMADVDPRNTRSLAMLAKLGFKKTGEAKNTYKIGETWTDSVYLTLHSRVLL